MGEGRWHELGKNPHLPTDQSPSTAVMTSRELVTPTRVATSWMPFSCTECDYLARSVSDLAGNIWMEMKMRIMNGLATLTLRIRIYMVIDIKFRASGFITFCI